MSEVPPPSGKWRFELLGRLRATRGEATVEHFRTQKTASLVALLAFCGGRPQPRERLAERFWPDAEPEAGRHSLNQTLSWIRKTFAVDGGSLLASDRTNVRFEPELLETDVAELERLVRGAQSAASDVERERALEGAVAAYGGEFLPALFDDWITVERDRLAELYLDACGELGRLAEARGDLPRAITRAREVIAVDPLRESAHRDLMRRLALGGQIRSALRHYRQLETLLRRELDVTPDAESRELARSIEAGGMRVRPAAAASDLQADPARAGRGGRIPVALTAFFGRERELAELGEMSQSPDTRLVTLTGSGGTGKTRLAAAWAGRLERSGRRVCFVQLADVTDAERLFDVIGTALGIERPPGRDVRAGVLAMLAETGGDGITLVLDNVEQLLPMASAVTADLLRESEGLTVVATSRVRLGIPGEREFPVPPLPLPDPDARGAALAADDCIRLFTDRAKLVRPAFSLDERSAGIVAEVCVRLEGIPLAIELAAARVHALSPVQIRDLLTRPLDLLESRDAGIPERHRTLRNAIAWSERLLPPDLREVFRSLSVFRGGWTLGAAEAVTLRETAFDDLAELRAASLVIAEDAGDHVRYRMLDTIRDYAGEGLDPADVASLRARHAGYYASDVHGSERHVWGERQAEWIARLTADVENLRRALAWLIDEGGDRDAGLDMAASLEWFWNTRGDWSEGREWLERALARARGGTRVRARATLALANLAERQGDFAVARDAYVDALALVRTLDEPAMLARTLHNLAIVLRDVGEYESAMAMEEEALGHFRQARDARGIAVCLNSLGVNAAERGDYATATRWFEETLDICRAMGSERGVAYALHNLGEAATWSGDLAAAEALLEEGLECARTAGDRGLTASLLTVLACAALEGAEPSRATERAGRALTASVELGDKRGIAACLDVAACVLAARGEAGDAVMLAAAADGLRMSIGHESSSGERAFVARFVGSAALGIDPSTRERAEALGAAIGPGRAAAMAAQFLGLEALP